MRWLVMLMVLFCVVLQSASPQDKPDQSQTEVATCTFQDGKQISVRYDSQGPAKKDELPLGEMWPHSGSPMYLFTETGLSVDKVEVARGAFSMYVIPEKGQWTLIINKAVSAGPYDPQQDLLRRPMQIGQLSEPHKHFEVAFAHVAPTLCNLRIYYGKTGAWIDIQQK